MDNDNTIVKTVKKKVKQISFRWHYRDISILNEKKGNEFIYQSLTENKPLMVARGGATEMRCVKEYLSKTPFSSQIKNEISTLSGVFPPTDDVISQFSQLYIECMAQADVLALWGVGAESEVVHKYCHHSVFTELRALEPYYFTDPWSKVLAGKKVLVVHPFVESILKQYNKRENIWKNESVLPMFKSLECVKAVQSIAGKKTDYESWFDALDHMKNEISKADFEIAVIGAGAYGLPLAAFCKYIGKKAVQMSGATQILFGIKGKRWDNHPVISKFYNDAWVRPLESETPPDSQKVEGGSYW